MGKIPPVAFHRNDFKCHHAPVSYTHLDVYKRQLPYSVEMSAVLADHIHQLWLLLMEQYKEKCPGVELAEMCIRDRRCTADQPVI